MREFVNFSLADMGCSAEMLTGSSSSSSRSRGSSSGGSSHTTTATHDGGGSSIYDGTDDALLASLVACRDFLAARDGDDVTPFVNPVQYIHVHRHSARIRAMAEGPQLGRTAAGLLGALDFVI